MTLGVPDTRVAITYRPTIPNRIPSISCEAYFD